MPSATADTYAQINRAAIEAGEAYRDRPLARMQPDRAEVMSPAGSGVRQLLGNGIGVEWQVGMHNGARNLSTGIVSMEPGCAQPRHRHHVEEAITALDGGVRVEVEDRNYDLAAMDSLLIPRGLSHRVANVSADKPARCHVALPISTVTTSPPTPETRGTAQPAGDERRRERLIRHAAAHRIYPSPGVTFIHFYSRDLTPGVRMCGGYGLFQPGGRLPAHVHDCDESICIVQGVATCWVEGRRYQLSDLATALEPRGRVHYFVNDSDGPMAMLWVYAAPTPARLVVDERCAVEPDVAWAHNIRRHEGS